MRSSPTAVITNPDLAAIVEGLSRPYLPSQDSLLPLLHALQNELGHIDDAFVPHIATALNLSRAEVHWVITFYHDFRRKPAGTHIVKLCRAEACQARGARRSKSRRSSG